MIKIEGVFVNSRYRFNGLYLSGNATDFGESYGGKVQRKVSLEDVYRLINDFGMHISGIESAKRLRGGAIQLCTVTNTHLYDYPMFYVSDRGAVMQIPNGMSIEAQYVEYDTVNKCDKVVGYGVVFDFDKQKRVTQQTIEGLAALSTYYRPKNFLVKEMQDGRIMFSGRQGVYLKEKPIYRIGADNRRGEAIGTAVGEKDAPRKQAITRNASTTAIKKGETNAAESMVDFLDVVSIAKKNNAVFVFLPKTEGGYTALTIDAKYDRGSEFIPQNIEIARPEIQFSQKTSKTNLRFKKYGKVNVQFNGAKIPVPCVMMSNKSVFDTEKQHMLSMMLSVPANKVEALQNELLAKTLTFTEVPDRTLCSLVNGVLGDGYENNRLLDVDTTHIIPMSPNRRESFMSIDIYEACEMLNNANALFKWLVTRESAIESVLPAGSTRRLNTEYLAYNSELISIMQEVGIDPYTGIYNPPESSKSINPATITGKMPIELEFAIPGFKAPTKNDMKDADTVINGKMASYLTGAKESIERIQGEMRKIDSRDVQGMLKLIRTEKDAAQKSIDKATKIIWCYNQAALLNGGYNTYKDKRKYTEVKSRMKTGAAYETSNGDKKVILKLRGVTLDASCKTSAEAPQA